MPRVTSIAKWIRLGQPHLYACPNTRCQVKVTKPAELERHQKTHRPPKDREFQCKWRTDCGFTANQKTGLVNHIRSIHLKMRIPCEQQGCDMTFSDPSALSRHRKMHLPGPNAEPRGRDRRPHMQAPAFSDTTQSLHTYSSRIYNQDLDITRPILLPCHSSSPEPVHDDLLAPSTQPLMSYGAGPSDFSSAFEPSMWQEAERSIGPLKNEFDLPLPIWDFPQAITDQFNPDSALQTHAPPMFVDADIDMVPNGLLPETTWPDLSSVDPAMVDMQTLASSGLATPYVVDPMVPNVPPTLTPTASTSMPANPTVDFAAVDYWAVPGPLPWEAPNWLWNWRKVF